LRLLNELISAVAELPGKKETEAEGEFHWWRRTFETNLPRSPE